MKRQKDSEKPSYKLWLGHITVVATQESFTFIWCEKGESKRTELSLSDFSFLAPFLDAKVCQEFGFAGR